ncbi:MAG: hypothetical protein ACFFAY_12795, partial [Promethearchaeota archaeon]
MRRALVLATILIITILAATPAAHIITNSVESIDTSNLAPDNLRHLASAGGMGNDANSVLFLSRTFTNNQTSVNNTYGWPSNHNSTIDLTQYHVSGWTLYKADMNVNTITASVERESIGVASASPFDQIFRIEEYNAPYTYAMLAQGFYNQPHAGRLENYSIPYATSDYNAATRGIPYMLIVSDYTDNSSGLTTPVVMDEHDSVFEYLTAGGENQILGASTIYYVYANGSELHPDITFSTYPTIYWRNQNSAGSFTTTRWSTEFMAWSSPALEGLVWYSYTPWNQTSNSALQYTDATSIGLNLNGVAASGLKWSTSSATNISSLLLETTQSVDIDYNLTLWYKKDATASTTWSASSSGSLIEWNATIATAYPSPSGDLDRYLNVSVPLDWVSTGVYNSTNPSTSHTEYTSTSTSVQTITCSNMADETWTFAFTAFNYVTDIRMYDSSDSSRIWTEASILVDLDIDVRIEDGSSVNVTTGSTNLTALHEGATVHAPALDNPTGSGSSFLWDISAELDNGTYTIEVFWTDGDEAGYLTKELTVFYETTLTPASSAIQANTDDSFLLSVQFDDDFNSIGIDTPDAVITYSFLATINATLTSDGGGQWTTTIDTTGLENGVFTLTVYAEGFAIENQSVAITVTLTHQTNLQLSWVSSTFDWTQSDVFYVNYTLTRNGSLIPDATQLIIEINGNPLILHGDNGTYWIAVNNTFDLGVHSIFVNISKNLFNPVWDSSASFTITEASTSLTVNWSPVNVTVEYTSLLNLTVDYTYAGGDVPSASTEVNVTINGDTYGLVYSGTQWEVSISAWELGPGVYIADIIAWLYGYQAQFNTTFNINVTVSTGIVVIPSWFTNTTDYVTPKMLQLNITYANGTAVTDALVTATMAGRDYFGSHIGAGIYNVSIGPLHPDVVPLGPQNVDLLITRTGFGDTSSSVTLTVNEAASTLLVTPPVAVAYYDEQITFDIYYELLNGSSIAGICTFDIDGNTFSPIWAINHWRITVQASNLGVGIHHLIINTTDYGFEAQSYEDDITINAIPTTVLVIESPSLYVNSSIVVNITYQSARIPTLIVPDNLTASWAGQFVSWETVIPGTLRVIIQSNGVHAGAYFLDITVNKTGYVNTTTQWIVQVNPVPTSILMQAGGYEEWENETVSIWVWFEDDFHTVYIHWASVNVTFEGVAYEATFDDESSRYLATIFLDSSLYEPGEYTVAIDAIAVDCVVGSETATLTINEKHQYTLELDVAQEVSAGGTLGVTASLTLDGTPVNAKSIFVYAQFNFSGVLSDPVRKVAVTTADGTADINFDVPSNATDVIVWGVFEGSRTEWAVITEILAVNVVPAPGLIEILISYLRDWRFVLLLVIGSVSAAVVSVYRRELQPKKYAAMSALDRQLSKFRDLLSLQHFLAVYLDRGTCVFYHPFGEQRIQADLISGFIAAITSVYGEIKGTGVAGQLEEVNYQGLKLNSYSGRFVIGILIVEGDMTPLLRERLQFFVETFEDQYEADLEGWTGVVDCFDPEWIVSGLHATFN